MKRLKHLYYALAFAAFLAVLNPSYSSAYVQTPTGTIKMEKYGIGPGSMFVHTRVVADETTATVEMR